MPNYQNGKIYKLITDINPELVYIGSTCQPLSKRKSTHKSKHKAFIAGKGHYVTSFRVFDVDPNPTIVLLEACPCNSKEELRARERHWIENTACVNQKIPGRTDKEYYATHKDQYKQAHKKYYETHKDKCKQAQKAYYMANKSAITKYRKDWCAANKDRIKQKKRQYYLDNKSKINARCRQYSKVYYAANKEKIRAKQSVKVECGCGISVCKSNVSCHLKSEKHKAWASAQ